LGYVLGVTSDDPLIIEKSLSRKACRQNRISQLSLKIPPNYSSAFSNDDTAFEMKGQFVDN
jgi:hypothetical protein